MDRSPSPEIEDDRPIRERFPDAFPRLTEAQIERLTRGRRCRTYEDGERLFTAGDPDFCFHFLHEGEIEIFGNVGRDSTPFLVHEAGDFTGDLEDLSGRGASVTAVARGRARVCEMSLDELRDVLNSDVELQEIIMRAFIARWEAIEASDQAAVNVWGRASDRQTFRIRDFLTKNRVKFNWYDPDADPERWLVAREEYGLEEANLPFVAQWQARRPEACDRSEFAWRLDRPSLRELADNLRLNRPIADGEEFDLVVVGSGPAGLAAAVYGASEGLKVLVVDRTAPGGQAGSSMRIENYLGFPMGLTGKQLARDATVQAQKFGAVLASPIVACRLESAYGRPELVLDEGCDAERRVRPKTLLIATGAEYTKLDVPELERYEGAGVYYSATPLEAQTCRQREVVIVGGGNSAGQACVFLAGIAGKVNLLLRGDDLRKSMSEYLVHRIEGLFVREGEDAQSGANIRLWTNTEVSALQGEPNLQRLLVRNRLSGEEGCIETNALFLFIGATPNSDWLPATIACEKGFVKTGGQKPAGWPLERAPFWLETSMPGVFAAGDVRLGSVKRVASAVGEGAMAVTFVHQVLADIAAVPR